MYTKISKILGLKLIYPSTNFIDKRGRYLEIFNKYNYKVYYIYILNNFFNNIRYNRIIDYNSKNGIRTFIYNNEEKLNDELDEYIKGL